MTVLALGLAVLSAQTVPLNEYTVLGSTKVGDRTVEIRNPIQPGPFANLPAAEWNDQLKGIAALFALSIFLMYVVLGIQFDSFLLPLLMLAIIPFGFSGVFIALFVTGSAINLNAILGSLVVIGFIVRNGIIFYDHYSALIRTRALLVARIYRGATDRIRAISISFLATLFALMPVAADLSGRNPERTMAIAIIGGLSFSSFLSLFIFPVIYRYWFSSRT